MKILALIFLLSSQPVAFAEVDAKVSSLIKENYNHIEAFYKDLHENPELSGEEIRTAGKVAAEMKRLGLEVITNIGGTGVVGILKNGKGPVTGVRAEMDALPIPENTNLPYKSKVPGKMHACGHDFHMSAVLAAAYVMANNRDAWKGTLVFVAQPAEETAKGALAMIKDGLFKKIPTPDQWIALHTSGLYKRGTIAITSGFALANVDSVDVIFKGKGTHGSQPHNGIDPFIQAAEFILKTQTLLGREKPSLEPAVVSIGSVHGGAKHNIIPEEVKLQLTVRTYDKDVRNLVKRRLQEVAKGIAKTNNAPEPIVSFPEATDATYNDPTLALRMQKLFTEKLGEKTVTTSKPVMGGEDFGYFASTTKVPSLFIWIGEKDDKNPTVINHSPLFAPDFKGTFPLATQAMSEALLDLHKK